MLAELTDAGAEFVLVGGHAVAYHGHPRATKDLDILVRPSPENAVRVYRALTAFGAPLDTFDVSAADFAAYHGVLQIGVAPRRIDILNGASGISFDEAIEHHGEIVVEGRPIKVIGKAALLKNKAAAGRAQDLADLAALERIGPHQG